MYNITNFHELVSGMMIVSIARRRKTLGLCVFDCCRKPAHNPLSLYKHRLLNRSVDALTLKRRKILDPRLIGLEVIVSKCDCRLLLAPYVCFHIFGYVWVLRGHLLGK